MKYPIRENRVELLRLFLKKGFSTSIDEVISSYFENISSSQEKEKLAETLILIVKKSINEQEAIESMEKLLKNYQTKNI